MRVYQQHKCNEYCLKHPKHLGKCRFGFPFDARGWDEELYNIYRYRRDDKEKDSRTVPHNWILLLLANSHLAVEFCTAEEISDYLTKYVVKAEILY